MGALPMQNILRQSEKCLTGPEEEHGELFDKPLEDPIVKAKLYKGHEEYYRLEF